MTAKLISKLFSGLTFFLLIFMSSCGSGGNSSDTASESKLFSEADQKIFNDISQIIEDLPPPSVVPETMQSLGAEFDEDIINDLSKLDNYLLEPSKAALNLGVYATDMGYLITYDQVQKSMDHMRACQKLAENLGVSTAFDLELIQQYESAMNDHEQLIRLLNKTIVKAEKRLGDSDQLVNAGLVLTGSFIEGLYLAVTVMDRFHMAHTDQQGDMQLEPLVKLVLSQGKVLDDIINLLQNIPPNKALNSIMIELDILKVLYSGDLAELEAQLNDNPDMVVTEDMLYDIILEVTRIRSKLIE